MNKKILIIASIVLGVLILGGWIYFFVSRNRGNTPQTPGIALPSSQPARSTSPSPQPSSQANQFEPLSSSWVISPTIQDNTVLFFDKTAKTLKSVVAAGMGAKRETALTETLFEGVERIAWSPKGNAALIHYIENGETKIAAYDLVQNLSYVLPYYLEAETWNPEGTKILSYHKDVFKNQFFVSTANMDGSQEQKLADLRMSGAQLYWPAKNLVYFLAKPAARVPIDNVFSYNLTNKILSTVALSYEETYGSSLYGITLKPNLDGGALFFSFTNPQSTQLLASIMNTKAKGEELSRIDLPFSTIAEKCAWAPSGETIYCAYSDVFTKGDNSVPFGYWMGDFSTDDSFARFNWKTGEFKVYAEHTAFDATEVSVSPDESFLVFINRRDMNLYKMKL